MLTLKEAYTYDELQALVEEAGSPDTRPEILKKLSMVDDEDVREAVAQRNASSKMS